MKAKNNSVFQNRDATIIDSWTNGSKALVHLVKFSGDPRKAIVKQFRRGMGRFLIKEFVILSYLKKLDITPRIIGIDLSKRCLLLEYMEGERLLEWTLARCSMQPVDLEAYKNMHGLDTNEVVASAFQTFQKSDDPEVLHLKDQIRESYRGLHRYRISQGDVRPRNLICSEGRVALIDFDHAMLTLRPAVRDNALLQRWYGISV